ncbi:hypothetical protein D3C78_763960 [compost metagenome]
MARGPVVSPVPDAVSPGPGRRTFGAAATWGLRDRRRLGRDRQGDEPLPDRALQRQCHLARPTWSGTGHQPGAGELCRPVPCTDLFPGGCHGRGGTDPGPRPDQATLRPYPRRDQFGDCAARPEHAEPGRTLVQPGAGGQGGQQCQRRPGIRWRAPGFHAVLLVPGGLSQDRRAKQLRGRFGVSGHLRPPLAAHQRLPGQGDELGILGGVRRWCFGSLPQAHGQQRRCVSRQRQWHGRGGVPAAQFAVAHGLHSYVRVQGVEHHARHAVEPGPGHQYRAHFGQ